MTQPPKEKYARVCVRRVERDRDARPPQAVYNLIAAAIALIATPLLVGADFSRYAFSSLIEVLATLYGALVGICFVYCVIGWATQRTSPTLVSLSMTHTDRRLFFFWARFCLFLWGLRKGGSKREKDSPAFGRVYIGKHTLDGPATGCNRLSTRCSQCSSWVADRSRPARSAVAS